MARITIMQKLVYDALRREANGTKVIHITELTSLLRYRIRFPKKYYVYILEELVELRLLKKLNRDSYEVLSCKHKPTSDSLGEPFW